MTVADDNADIPLVVPFNRQFYEFNPASVKDGGDVVIPVKVALPVSAEAFASFIHSTSDVKWVDYIKPTSLLFLKSVEGVYPYGVFDVAGQKNAKFICVAVPFEVSQKVFPKLYDKVSQNPDEYGLNMNGSKNSVQRNQERIDALKWVPTDCQSTNNKSKTLKPCKPSPLVNQWAQADPAIIKMLNEVLKNLSPKNQGTKRKVGETGDDSMTVPSFATFRTTGNFPHTLWDLALDLSGGNPHVEHDRESGMLFIRNCKKKYETAEAESSPAAVTNEDDDEDD